MAGHSSRQGKARKVERAGDKYATRLEKTFTFTSTASEVCFEIGKMRADSVTIGLEFRSSSRGTTRDRYRLRPDGKTMLACYLIEYPYGLPPSRR